MWTKHPAGAPNVLELAVGPAMVAVIGAFGVALARWWPSVVAAPVTFVGLAGLQLYVMYQLPARTSAQFEQHLRWLAFWVPISTSGDPARELVVRPSAWHLLFLVGLIGLFGALALVRHGLLPRPVAALAAALALVVLAATNQVQLPTAAQQRALLDLVVHPERHQTCRTELGVRYCAYPSYAGWIDRWSAPVSAVIRRLPNGDRPAGLMVRQTLNVWGGDVPLNQEGQPIGFDHVSSQPAIPVTDTWGHGRMEGQYELELALVVAADAVGIPWKHFPLTREQIQAAARALLPPNRREFLRDLKPGQPSIYCDTLGQARSVVAIWLAGQATTRTRGALFDDLRLEPYGLFERRAGSYFTFYYTQDVAKRGSTILSYHGRYLDALNNNGSLLSLDFPILWGEAEARYVAQLLKRSPAAVSGVMAEHWGELTDPSTPTRTLLKLFGMRRLPTLREQLRDAGLDPDRAIHLDNNVVRGSVACP
jgi:hypothetical protein